MKEKHLLITGRPASGKTEILIAFANMFPKTTLFLSEECTEDLLKNKKGLNELVKVVNSSEFTYEETQNYTSLCVDYLELLSDETLQKIIKTIKQSNLQVIVTSQVKRRQNEVLDRIESLISRRH